MMEKLSVKNLTFTYAGMDNPVLRDINLSLGAGEFTLLTGRTGCGKSTLLRLIKRELAPRGNLQGQILFQGRPTENFSNREAAEKIGFVFQRPEQQIVTDRVWHELAFGLENLAVPEREMRRRVAETAQFFGMEEYLDARPDQLSGGQKQMLNLAAVMVMEPELLILDEPTARLDPIAGRSFLAMLQRLHRELGVTILMVEHRLEDVLDQADRVIWMEAGRIRTEGEPAALCDHAEAGSILEGALPASARIWCGTGKTGSCPLNAGEGRRWLADRIGMSVSERQPVECPEKEKQSGKTETAEEALRFREVWFRFSREGKDILRSVDFTVRSGEIFALLGGNGSGKTTFLRTAGGMISPYSGEIRLFGKKLKDYRFGTLRHEGVAMLPQDVQTLFLRDSVAEELKDSGIRLKDLPFDLSPFLNRHPYDLSGGEQQLLGLAKVLASKPKVLLLDEPTGGLDAEWRERIRTLLKQLQGKGMTLLIVTHDAEFASETADRCGLLFQGRVEAADEMNRFFTGTRYYGTPVTRITRGLLPGCVTVDQAVTAVKEAAGIRRREGGRQQ